MLQPIHNGSIGCSIGSSGNIFTTSRHPKSTVAGSSGASSTDLPNSDTTTTTSTATTPTTTTGKLDEYGHPYVDLSFTNAKEAYRSKTNFELIRALLVFNLCSVRFLVDNNKEILKWVRRILGKTLFTKLMKATFYGQFVAGEDQDDIRPTIEKNMKFGVKSILDYSVEKDLSSEEAKKAEMMSCTSDIQSSELPDPEIKRYRAHEDFGDRRDKVFEARTYFYKDEADCDENMNIFLNCIDAVSGATDGSGFAAIKLTALGRPQLLLQMSEVLVSTRAMFDRIAGTHEDILMRSFREKDLRRSLKGMGIPLSRDETKKWFTFLDSGQDGEVDLLDWDNLLEVSMSLHKVFNRVNLETGKEESLITALTEEEENQMKNMLYRINKIAKYAKQQGVRVMIDAEQTYFQPAISRLAMEMMRKFNKDRAVIFNTYQCYLKATLNSIIIDLDVSRKEDFYFGAKLVRGAYMEQERERAHSLGYDDPVCDDFEHTTQNYYNVLNEVMSTIQRRDRGKVSVMVASHNEETVKYTVDAMKAHGIKPADKLICFGQLLGMCDQVSFPMGQAGYSVYKYVPYGPVEDVIPYLSRRAQENRGILKKVKKEKKLLFSELRRRILRGKLIYRPALPTPPPPPPSTSA
ncbi:proline dehydrogenase 1, mitochondrial-like [Argonauta hians]